MTACFGTAQTAQRQICSREKARGALGEMEWIDDPIFDDAEERFCGKMFKGEAWRRLQVLKAQGLVDEVVSVAGASFRRAAIEGLKHYGKVSVVSEDNPHDTQAQRVEVGGSFVGYIPKGKPLSPCARVNVLKWGTEPTPHVWLGVGVGA